ncbi:DNA methylase [Burkholderia ubonensis]|uniref:site-specific DNA-methyltransferase n=1 Tax=Burkholderia ubonensis TaxID=101571 RepID=UPI0007571406|nr:site-specific DNA-methyltransferase [Burkholderia ubonensis]KWK96370.1 DNA methylase [Burkholderia ubonensis]KWN01558.1 DNA methylase [Burkholderia ubonensis]KWN27898.1 DNA methylase [Burkholderia ubonensis]ODQ28913.1 DNA methylase [Burkholderia ubonensis]
MPFLDWVNKNQAKETALAVPYHLLNRDSIHGDAAAAAENLLVHGDNLLALKALMPFYAGRVKCIFIDPPYNTQSAFDHYDDRLEHSQWLSMMYPRLQLLRELLAEDGSIWVTVDDNEAHYLKVLMDEIFGRNNFIATVIWRKNYAPKSSARHFSVDHDYVHVFAKSADLWTPNPMSRNDEQDAIYKNPDNDPRGRWRPDNLSARNPYSLGTYPITTPGGRVIEGPPAGRYWAISKDKLEALDADGRIWWGKDGKNVPALKRFLSEVKQGRVPQTYWAWEEVGHTQDAKKEAVALTPNNPFATPKPEKLMQRILEIASNPGDLVLDSFLGSGTTAAVAHKMGRRYVGIEMEAQARTHCIPRLEKVIAGEQGGISEAVQWKGGGGFSFCTLGETAFDEHGRLNPDVKFSTLAAYIWHVETGIAGEQTFDSPFLGVHDGKAYFLLYNGILGDRRPASGNVLNSAILAHLRTLWQSPMPIVVYGETTRVGPARLAAEAITFRQIPYDISMR